MRLACLLLTTCLARAAFAQEPDTAYAERAFARLKARLGADTTMPAGLRSRIAAERLDNLSTDLFARLDDTSAVALMRAFTRTLGVLPDSQCGSFLRGSGDAGYLDAVARVDSTVLDEWMRVFEQGLRAQADTGRVLRVAAETESQAAIIGIVGRLESGDRQRIMAAFGASPPTDQCWAARTVFVGIAQLPPPEAGPLVRSMFRTQPQPKALRAKPSPKP